MKKGFTLVEMLVVIAILGILMAMMIPAAGMILRRAKVAQAKADAGVVTTVLLKYQAEYNRWPGFYATEEAAGQLHLTDKGWVDVMSPSPEVNTPNKDNVKRIIFFSPGGGVLGVADGPYPGGFVDPWGNAFSYRVDQDQDGNILNPDADATGMLRVRALAWSAGPDGDPDTWEDNVKSWE